ncbi:uncharacterized protein LOC122458000 isoform X3 [Dermochelys coriacea]|uniref:uncharacterized protein LOC122458000 isoform X3 n=1 Tax=Dermochelys coriacea TaxID=27794 RepID=UPI001CA7E25A|nr:uncharacterized protein LOC122458000 isoform X3 [Dermochelys coriacea]
MPGGGGRCCAASATARACLSPCARVCVCVCVCARARARAGGGTRQRRPVPAAGSATAAAAGAEAVQRGGRAAEAKPGSGGPRLPPSLPPTGQGASGRACFGREGFGKGRISEGILGGIEGMEPNKSGSGASGTRTKTNRKPGTQEPQDDMPQRRSQEKWITDSDHVYPANYG